MKRRICIPLILALLLTTVACSPQKAERVMDAVEDAVEQSFDAAEEAVDRRLDAVEDAVETAVKDATRITPAPVPKAEGPATEPVSAVSVKPTEGAEEYLSPEQAQIIALEHANLTAEEVTRLHAQFDMDDGVPEYDVEFRHGRLEYEYEIHAVTGAVRSYDVDS